MTKRTILLALMAILLVSAMGAAQESAAFNLMVSDQNTRLIEGFTEVRIYAVDPVTEHRLDMMPTVTLRTLRNPIQILLDPGYYEFVVWMFYLPEEVPYFRFKIREGEQSLVNLLLIKLPEELITY